MRVLLFLSVLLVLGGCSVGPDYQKPEWRKDIKFIVPRSGLMIAQDSEQGLLSLCLHSKLSAESAKCRGHAVQVLRWWQLFNDEALNTILTRVALENRDLHRMVANLDVALADRRRSISSFFPGVLPGLDYVENKSSAANAPGLPASALKNGFINARANFSWEIDVLGRLRRQYESSAAMVERVEADTNGVLVMSLAEAANAYIDYRKFQRQLLILNRVLRVERQLKDKITTLVNLGQRTPVDSFESRARVQALKSQIPDIKYAIGVQKERLKVLGSGLGDGVETLLRAIPKHPVIYAGPVTIEKPEELLKERPDVVSAERALAGAVGDVGVAVAELFPRVEFSGNIGYAANSFFDLGSSVANTYSLVPRLTWALLDSGRLRAEIARRQGMQMAALAFYEQTINLSLEEAQNALNYFNAERLRLIALRKLLRDREEIVRVKEAQYDVGAIDLLALLLARQDLLNAKLNLEESYANMAKAVVLIYKAFGGVKSGVVT
jgi:multidrug efflux system outer membrane protein